jgi:hypothetical protein
MRSLLQFFLSLFSPKKTGSETWERDSPWRQGHIIPPKLAAKLKLIPKNDPHQKFAVVVSHDCDIACELAGEPHIEVIVGTRLESCRPEHMNAKHVRVLDLEFVVPQGKMALELVATEKRTVNKMAFQGYQPDPNFALPDKELQALRSWLAARYRRAVIPDGLQTLVKEIFEDTFKKSGRPRALDRIYVDFEPDVEELPPGEKYELTVVLVYDSQEIGSKEIAEQTAERLITLFRKKYLKGGVWTGVELRGCEVKTDTSFTLFDVKVLKQVRLEYLSLRAELPGEPHEE